MVKASYLPDRVQNEARAVEDALHRELAPHAAALRGARVTIAVPDATRPLDPMAALDPLLAWITDAGAREMRVLVALGLHRAMRGAELAPLAEVAGRHGAPLAQHAPADPRALASFGATAEGVPKQFHRHIADADLVVCVGLVEPHQYAGFSGGVKTVAIGCAGRATISAMHGLRYLRDPAMRLGAIEGNPFRAALGELVVGLPPIYALEVVPGFGAFAGLAEESFRRAAAVAAREMFFEVDAEADVVILEVPGAKAKSFYQASRAASYVALSERPAIKQGGLLAVVASCPEGIGEGEGERACEEAMMRGRAALMEELRGDSMRPLDGGEQRAFVVARALERAEIAVIGAPYMPALEKMGIAQLASLTDLNDRLAPPARALFVPDVFRRVPRVGAYARR